ncbi:MFS transporter [Paraburkholderia tropica]|uniref:MFS transporter n=1 Tax=Paraburkholderia tropica TaxID=92647 RepID=UPI002ABD314E|nr:MFS transporter [Paraburkholderia tropica]
MSVANLLDRSARLTARQKLVAFVGIANGTLEFFDQYVIAFVLLFILKPWHLTYGQTAVVLLSSGLGSMVGSFVWGWFADRFGRRPAMLCILLALSGSSICLSLTPDGGWLYLSVFRAGIGFGVGGYSVVLAMVQEFMPAAKRGLVGGAISISAAFGLLLASLMTSLFAEALGWRGMFLIGGVPALFSLFVFRIIPESPRWAAAKGRMQVARRATAWTLGVDEASLPAMPDEGVVVSGGSWSDLFRYRRSLIVGSLISFGIVTGYYGLFLWGPTLLVQVLGLTPKSASHLMLVAGVSGIVSRLLFSWLLERWGRRGAGVVATASAAVAMAIAGVAASSVWATGFGIFFLVACFFCDGCLAISGPYTTEIWPARLRAAGAGWTYGTAGLGKMIGPAGLALIVGSSDVLTPKATIGAALPAFLFLGGWLLLAGVSFLFARETRGLSLEEIEAALERDANSGASPSHLSSLSRNG